MSQPTCAPVTDPAEKLERSPLPAGQTPSVQSLLFALPKGRLTHDSLTFLKRAGLPVPTDTASRKLVLPAADGSIGFVMAKPGDVPTYVEHGAADLGICGLDVVRETDRAVYEPLLLPFGHCRLCLAGPADCSPPQVDATVERPEPVSEETASSPGATGMPLRYMSQPRIATEFPRLTRQYFAARGVNAEIIALGGSVELGPILGLADLIVDIVQTGETLRLNGLVEMRTVLQSQAVLLVNRTSYQLRATAINRIIERMGRLTT